MSSDRTIRCLVAASLAGSLCACLQAVSDGPSDAGFDLDQLCQSPTTGEVACPEGLSCVSLTELGFREGPGCTLREPTGDAGFDRLNARWCRKVCADDSDCAYLAGEVEAQGGAAAGVSASCFMAFCGLPRLCTITVPAP